MSYRVSTCHEDCTIQYHAHWVDEFSSTGGNSRNTAPEDVLAKFWRSWYRGLDRADWDLLLGHVSPITRRSQKEFITAPSEMINPIFSSNIIALEKLRQLERGWDGEDAPPINEASFTLAKKILERIGTKVFSIPTSEGTVQLEIYCGSNSMEIEIQESSFCILKVVGSSYEELEVNTVEDVYDHIQEIGCCLTSSKMMKLY